MDAEVEGRAEITLVFIYLLYYGAYPPTIKDMGKVVLLAEGGEESPKPTAPAAVRTRVRELCWL